MQCNLCGEVSAPVEAGREVASCAHCGSTVRLRALAALISREILGVDLALPDFPVLKGLRGIGMSDPAALASRLAEKFDYTNTFYHQEPRLDITQPAESQYDFIVSSEVLEHVPPPVDRAFQNLFNLLKTDGLLFLTVPYRPNGPLDEHFPELHEYDLASPGGRTVLVNRRRDGTTELFEDLCFHGGDGSTLEMRVFSESSLKEMLRCAGFNGVRIATESIPEFGVHHGETWSLPLVARKGSFQPPFVELAAEYRKTQQRTRDLERELNTLRAEYEKFQEFHRTSHHDMDRQLTERQEWGQRMQQGFEERTQWALSLKEENAKQLAEKLEWIHRIERDLDERTQWALSLKQEKEQALADFREIEQRVQALERQLAEAQANYSVLESRTWTRLGRKLGRL